MISFAFGSCLISQDKEEVEISPACSTMWICSMEKACKCLKDTVVSQGKSTHRASKKEQAKICPGVCTARWEDDNLGEGVTKIKWCCSLLLWANRIPAGLYCCWLDPAADLICPLYCLSSSIDTTVEITFPYVVTLNKTNRRHANTVFWDSIFFRKKSAQYGVRS